MGHDKNTCRELPAGWKVEDTPKARWADRRNGLAVATQENPDDNESVCGDYQLSRGIFAISGQHEDGEPPTHVAPEQTDSDVDEYLRLSRINFFK